MDDRDLAGALDVHHGQVFMRVIVVGDPPDRAAGDRARAAAIQIVGEFRTLASGGLCAIVVLAEPEDADDPVASR